MATSTATTIFTPRPAWNVLENTMVPLFTRLVSLLPFLLVLACIWIHTLLLSPLGAMAAPVNGTNTSIPGPGALAAEFQSTSTTTLGIIFIVTGLLLLALGRFFFKLCLAIVGGYFFAWLGFLLLTFLNNNFQVQITVAMFWGVCLAFALIGALLAFFFFKVALFLSAGVMGFFFATWILSLGVNGLIPTDVGRRVFVYVIAALMAILVLFFEKFLLNLILPIVGSYLMFLGIDVFAKTGFTIVFTMVISAYSSNGVTYHPDPSTYGMLAGFAVVALLGIYINFRRDKK